VAASRPLTLVFLRTTGLSATSPNKLLAVTPALTEERPIHLLARASHAKWLDGYRVVIAEVRREYGVKGLGLTATT
jgi:hypothetical protein